MEKWIFVNNITSLDKLFYLTKAVNENNLTDDNQAKFLMDTLNEHGANRNEANNHPINYVLFYNMVYKDGNSYKTTNQGLFLINNYKRLMIDKQFRAEFFFSVLNDIKYPTDAVETSNVYKLHPFTIIFKLLCDDRLNKAITVGEMEELLSYCHLDSDYDDLVNKIIKYRKKELINIECERIAQVPTVVAGWVNQFNVMKKEGEKIMISDELKKLIPILNETKKININPYADDFCSYVIKKYLIDGLSMSTIENKYFQSEERKGFLAKDVIDYYNINNESNKAIYHDKNIELVCKLLNMQSDSRYKRIASILSNEKYDFESEKEENNSTKKVTCAYNMIYYGTPGCGKSYLVNKDFNDQEYIVYRTTFHPEYSNSDFVGQILPKTEGNDIRYEFQEGPFTLALYEALKNPSKKICLIIEEINRGNASAIFGDIFQLLDRDNDGASIYSINNEPIKKCLNEKGINIDKISIPPNMWIIATMNTSDQNVFTLDTAFKRRWRMHRIINEFNKNESYDNKLASMYIPGSSYTWEDFITTINAEIMKKNPTGLNSEDKQLGVYFVTENELSMIPVNNDKEAMDKFIEKVLLYIWEDVAKLDPSLWFDEKINSFDDLVKAYYDNKLRIFKDIFTDKNNESQTSIINE